MGSTYRHIKRFSLLKLYSIMGSSCSTAVAPSHDGNTSQSTMERFETYTSDRPTESFISNTMQEVQHFELRASAIMNAARVAPAARRKTSVYTEATAVSSVIGHVFESEKVLWESRLKWIPRAQREQIAREPISM